MLWLVILAGFFNGLSPAFDGGETGDVPDLVLVLIRAVGTSVVAGILWFHVLSWFAHRVGLWFGGMASVSQLRAAMAWPSLVWIALGAVWIAELAIYGRELFTSEPVSATLYAVLRANFWFGAAALLGFVLLTTICVREVQRFSVWKAFASIGSVYLLIGALLASLYWLS